ncbi:DnaA N-terminal domain-containing protein [Sporosarcina jeotgali]|uniref:DnaA N-terminal domain-containing protein n=1 Tax=Sporosarcina jeotgali TaxID=3020056 RepID=A0ABZ0KV08_9BACL|nr:DnaA N-terminal domain-containing protein [Sporosarcina sp. B2O-1]WOV83688.1 DnaA N-terminal domain-containing protein [Sporosarcina sp. B2O-1]
MYSEIEDVSNIRICAYELTNQRNLESDAIVKAEDQFLLWNDVLLKVQGGMSATKFKTWFKNTTAIQLGGQHVGVVCRNSFQVEWLKTHYRLLILNILEELTGEQFELDFLVE